MQAWASQVELVLKNLPEMQELQETQVWPLAWEDPLEEEMVTDSSILAWRIPRTEEPIRLLGVSGPWGLKKLDTTEVT